MDQLINGLIEKVGLDKEKAEQVIAFLKENASNVPQWLAATGMEDKVKDMIPDSIEDKLGGLFGG